MMRLSLLILTVLLAACGNKGGLVDTVEPKAGYTAVFHPSVQIMPQVTPEMNTLGFWIAHTAYPDSLIMSETEIASFNKEVLERHYLPSITDYPSEVDGGTIKDSINTLYNAMAARKLFNQKGQRIKSEQLKSLYELTGAANIRADGRYPVTKAVIVEYTDHLNLPTEDYFLRQADYGSFNRLQMSSLDIGTPVAVLYTSTDEAWYYVRSQMTVGWVRAHTLAFAPDKDIALWENMPNFVVAVQAKVSIYDTEERTGFRGWLPLGAKLPVYELFNNNDNTTALMYPYRAADAQLAYTVGYVENGDIHRGYLPYTSRNMLTIALRMLNTPYGWGGMYGEQDCSGLLIRIFNAAGLILPRNSSELGQTGEAIYSTDTAGIDVRPILTASAIPGMAVVQMPGHIMLYIGQVHGEPYVLHAIWSFEESIGGKFIARRIPARVVISPLGLSNHTARGPYYERITNIRNYR